MLFEKRKTNDRWLIVPEDQEKVEDIAIAVARASFETAEAKLMGFVDYDSRDKWEDVRNKVKLFPDPFDPKLVLHLDYINGRRCKSTVWKRGGKLFFHAGIERESDAKLILTMANDFLHGKRTILPLKPPGIWE